MNSYSLSDEYLENLRNTKGKKSSLSPAKLTMKLLNPDKNSSPHYATNNYTNDKQNDQEFTDENSLDSETDDSDLEKKDEDENPIRNTPKSPNKKTEETKSKDEDEEMFIKQPNFEVCRIVGTKIKLDNIVEEHKSLDKPETSVTYSRSIMSINKQEFANIGVNRKSSFSKSPSSKPQADKQSSKSSSINFNWIFASLLVVLLSYSVFTFMFSPININGESVSTNDLAKLTNYKDKFNNYVKFLKSKYPNQTSLFWANIQSSFRHSILKSKDPSIILIVSDQSTRNLASDLAFDVLNSIKMSIEEQSRDLNKLIINPDSDKDLVDLISNEKNDLVKLHIDNKLNEIFKSGQRIALVKSINRIPPTSMLLFYTYGDDLTSCKYPGIIILMTLELDEIIGEERKAFIQHSSKLTGYVENYLFAMWSNQVGEDQLRPVFTRIANNCIFVN